MPKLQDYVLNENHPVGKFKARVFQSMLSINPDNAWKLKDEILNKLSETETTTSLITYAMGMHSQAT